MLPVHKTSSAHKQYDSFNVVYSYVSYFLNRFIFNCHEIRIILIKITTHYLQLLEEDDMNELTECPKCLSDELLISDNENTVICSGCGVIKKDGMWFIAQEPKIEITA